MPDPKTTVTKEDLAAAADSLVKMLALYKPSSATANFHSAATGSIANLQKFIAHVDPWNDQHEASLAPAE